jgi:Holliday junction resolvase
MKKIALIVTLCSFIALPTFAKTFKLPNDDFAVASIDFPKDWQPEEINNGAAGQSPDDAVYLAAVAVGSDKGMDAELEDTFAMLKEHKVKLDESSKKENKFKLNGEEVSELIFFGKDEDGPCSISISFVPIKDKVIVLTYWVTTEKVKEHQEEVGKILHSIKPVE